MRNFSSNHSYDTAFQLADYFDPELKPYIYILWSKLTEGHICVGSQEILPDHVWQLFPDFPGDTKKHRFKDDGTPKPVIECKGNFYLQRYYQYETTIIERIRGYIQPVEMAAAIPPIELTPETSGEINWQAIAIFASLINKFTIITGGPGTGKTTTVAKILDHLFQMDPGMKVALAAPTGKAAARMADSMKNTGRHLSPAVKEKFDSLTPSTIHRLLGSTPESVHFRHNKSNTLPFDLLIVDECSMIDVALFAKLLDAIPSDCKVILLGDRNQLASVEAGSLFGDLCNLPGELNRFSESMIAALENIAGQKLHLQSAPGADLFSDHIIELKKSFRFSDEKGIGKLSKNIIDQDLDSLMVFADSKDPGAVIDLTYDEHIFIDFVSGFSSFIKEENIAKALKNLNDLKVLCATRNGSQGLYQTNFRIEKILQEKGLINPNIDFYENRPVMITKNNYQLNLFNGDTGIVRKDEHGKLKVWFDINNQIKGFSPSMISNEETAFAMTIHKSQGSEFINVLVLLPDFDVSILSRELIYTAVTRAREKVIIQSNENILKDAVQRIVKRGSGIKERF